MSFDRASRIAWLKEEAKKRVLLLDGAWGVMMQGYKLGEAEFRGTRFADHDSELKGDNDLLTLTRPDIVRLYMEGAIPMSKLDLRALGMVQD